MLTQFSRTELLFGKEAMDKLAGSKVAVFGICLLYTLTLPTKRIVKISVVAARLPKKKPHLRLQRTVYY